MQSCCALAASVFAAAAAAADVLDVVAVAVELAAGLAGMDSAIGSGAGAEADNDGASAGGAGIGEANSVEGVSAFTIGSGCGTSAAGLIEALLTTRGSDGASITGIDVLLDVGACGAEI